MHRCVGILIRWANSASWSADLTDFLEAESCLLFNRKPLKIQSKIALYAVVIKRTCKCHISVKILTQGRGLLSLQQWQRNLVPGPLSSPCSCSFLVTTYTNRESLLYCQARCQTVFWLTSAERSTTQRSCVSYLSCLAQCQSATVILQHLQDHASVPCAPTRSL